MDSKRLIPIPPRHFSTQTALIISHPLDLKCLLNLLPKPQSKQSLALARIYEFDKMVIGGPCLGRPQLFVILEHLYAWGITNLFFWGWCGAIAPEIKIGDIVIPENSDKCPVFEDVLNNLDQSKHWGPVLSIDNPYALERQWVIQLQAKGVMALDMESQGLFKWGKSHALKTGAILVVSDLLYTKEWTPGFKNKLFRHSRQSLAKEFKRVLSKIT